MHFRDVVNESDVVSVEKGKKKKKKKEKKSGLHEGIMARCRRVSSCYPQHVPPDEGCLRIIINNQI